jgi:hypothetical protein
MCSERLAISALWDRCGTSAVAVDQIAQYVIGQDGFHAAVAGVFWDRCKHSLSCNRTHAVVCPSCFLLHCSLRGYVNFVAGCTLVTNIVSTDNTANEAIQRAHNSSAKTAMTAST